jgi:hypothetical protein
MANHKFKVGQMVVSRLRFGRTRSFGCCPKRAASPFIGSKRSQRRSSGSRRKVNLYAAHQCDAKRPTTN